MPFLSDAYIFPLFQVALLAVGLGASVWIDPAVLKLRLVFERA